MKIKHTNQLEIAQNEIWTWRKFPAIRYCPLRKALPHTRAREWG